MDDFYAHLDTLRSSIEEKIHTQLNERAIAFASKYMRSLSTYRESIWLHFWFHHDTPWII